MPFKKLYIARPGAILPVHKQKNIPFILKLQYAMVKVFTYITPALIITSVDLAKALLHIIKNNKPGQLLYNDVQLKQIAKQVIIIFSYTNTCLVSIHIKSVLYKIQSQHLFLI